MFPEHVEEKPLGRNPESFQYEESWKERWTAVRHAPKMVHHILWQINKPYLNQSECNFTVQCIKWLKTLTASNKRKIKLPKL